MAYEQGSRSHDAQGGEEGEVMEGITVTEHGGETAPDAVASAPIEVTSATGGDDGDIRRDEDYLRIVAALKDPRINWLVDANNLEAVNGVITLVEKFLLRDCNDSSFEAAEKLRCDVTMLMQCSPFLPFLIRVLKRGVGQIGTFGAISRSLHHKSLWIFGMIIMYGNKKLTDGLARSGSLFPLLVSYLKSTDSVVYEQAVFATAQVVQVPALRFHLLPVAPHIFPLLTQIISQRHVNQRHVNPSLDPTLMKNIAAIVAGILIMPDEIHAKLLESGQPDQEGRERVEDFLQLLARPDIKVYLPSLQTVKALIPTIKALLSVNNDKDIYGLMLYCISVILRVFQDVHLLIAGGLVPKIVSAISDSDKAVMVYAVMVLGILSLKHDNLLVFMNSIVHSPTETGWLRKYWRIIQHLESGIHPPDEIKLAIKEFLLGLTSLLTNKPLGPPHGLSVNALYESGLPVSLGHLLEISVPMDIKSRALCLLRGILNLITLNQRQIFMNSRSLEASSLVQIMKEKLSPKTHPLVRPTAARLLGYYVENCTSRRDEAIACGALPTLLDLLKEWSSTPEIRQLTYILFAITALLEAKPKLELEVIKDLPAAIQELWKKSPPIGKEDVSERFVHPAKCLGIVASCGREGIALILKEDRLLRSIMWNLTASSDLVQQTAMATVLQICKGTTEHRMRLLEEGVLNRFPELMNASEISTRKQVLECLYGFLCEGKLNQKQWNLVRDKLWPLVKKEMKLDTSDTGLISKFVHDEIRCKIEGKK